MEVASLFAGIGGFDLGFEACGFKIVCQVERDKYCRRLLRYRWPDVPKIRDIRDVKKIKAHIVCGGDPCQSRSLAKGGQKSRHPDLSGYFLAVAGRSGARWVVRENVPSPDVIHFSAALEALGYAVVVVELNAKDFTSQSRRRQFVVASDASRIGRFSESFCLRSDANGRLEEIAEAGAPYAACITAHPSRLSESDSLVYERGMGLRLLDQREAEALQGFPGGWTAGFSRTRRAIMLGNAVPPPMVEWVGRHIIKAEGALNA